MAKIKNGCIYIATNKAFPNYFKIGNTTKKVMEQRFYANSSLPEDFYYEYVFESSDIFSSEKQLHEKFNNYRHTTVSGRITEFFKIECLSEALKYAKKISKDCNTKASIKNKNLYQNLSEERSSFRKYKIPVGSILEYRDKNLGITVKTLNEGNQVIYNGQSMSISAATLQIWKEKGKNATTANGFAHFRYKGTIILEIKTYK